MEPFVFRRDQYLKFARQGPLHERALDAAFICSVFHALPGFGSAEALPISEEIYTLEQIGLTLSVLASEQVRTGGE